MMKKKYFLFVFILILLFISCLLLERSAYAQGVVIDSLKLISQTQQNDTHPKSLSERLVKFILSLLEPEPKKIDETLVRDHL